MAWSRVSALKSSMRHNTAVQRSAGTAQPFWDCGYFLRSALPQPVSLVRSARPQFVLKRRVNYKVVQCNVTKLLGVAVYLDLSYDVCDARPTFTVAVQDEDSGCRWMIPRQILYEPTCISGRRCHQKDQGDRSAH